MEGTLYEVDTVCRHAGLRRSDNSPDEIIILNFLHVVYGRNVGQCGFDTAKVLWQLQGLKPWQGSNGNVKIIAAPTPIKGQDVEGDPETRQVKRDNEYWERTSPSATCNGKCSLTPTQCHVHNITQDNQLIHGKVNRGRGSAGYPGIGKGPKHEFRDVDWCTVMRFGRRAEVAPAASVVE